MPRGSHHEADFFLAASTRQSRNRTQLGRPSSPVRTSNIHATHPPQALTGSAILRRLNLEQAPAEAPAPPPRHAALSGSAILRQLDLDHSSEVDADVCNCAVLAFEVRALSTLAEEVPCLNWLPLDARRGSTVKPHVRSQVFANTDVLQSSGELPEPAPAQSQDLENALRGRAPPATQSSEFRSSEFDTDALLTSKDSASDSDSDPGEASSSLLESKDFQLYTRGIGDD